MCSYEDYMKMVKSQVRVLHERSNVSAFDIVTSQERKDLLTKPIYAEDPSPGQTGAHCSVLHATSNGLLEELVRREKEYEQHPEG